VESAAARRARAAGAIDCYRRLLERYHRTLDLMSDRGLDELDAKLDDAWAYAAALERWSGPGTTIDVGTGAGLPGAVLAAAAPSRRFVWVERRRRRATFLTMLAAECRFPNVEVFAADVRVLDAGRLRQPLAAVTAQAVGGWTGLYAWTRHLHADRVVFIGRRGPAWEDEVAALAQSISAQPAVLAAEVLGRGGTLVVLSAPGGCPCR
jgi:16S rRNA (guanine527-N7)-methyltransferase